MSSQLLHYYVYFCYHDGRKSWNPVTKGNVVSISNLTYVTHSLLDCTKFVGFRGQTKQWNSTSEHLILNHELSTWPLCLLNTSPAGLLVTSFMIGRSARIFRKTLSVSNPDYFRVRLMEMITNFFGISRSKYVSLLFHWIFTPLFTASLHICVSNHGVKTYSRLECSPRKHIFVYV